MITIITFMNMMIITTMTRQGHNCPAARGSFQVSQWATSAIQVMIEMRMMLMVLMLMLMLMMAMLTTVTWIIMITMTMAGWSVEDLETWPPVLPVLIRCSCYPHLCYYHHCHHHHLHNYKNLNYSVLPVLLSCFQPQDSESS